MIPILYEKTETEFKTNGLGRLVDAISCTVTEERNGPYELAMEYPISGLHYEDIAVDRIIFAEPFQQGDWQPFRIYKIGRSIGGVVTINAEHISYMLNKIVLMPFTAGSCTDLMQKIPQHAANACPFTFNTDKSVSGTFTVDVPKAIRPILGGETGSVLDVYGTGEYEFNRFNVMLHVNRGRDNGVTLRYGKNITDLLRETNIENAYTGIVPFWKGSEGTNTVTLPESVVWSTHRSEFAYDIIKPVDFSAEWQNEPTVAQLRTRAQAYVESNEGWKPADNIKVSFAQTWQSSEYEDVSVLETVHMCDTVTVVYAALGVEASAKVIKTTYNVLEEKYDSIELGTARNSLASVLTGGIAQEVEAARQQATQQSQALIEHQIALLQGALGGNVVLNRDDDGHPYEILFMNGETLAESNAILRINNAGIGFGTSYDNITTAWTIDGSFTAAFIQTWILTANIIQTGILKGKIGNNWWNLDTGELHMEAGNTTIGNSTVASADDVSTAESNAKSYADGKASSAETAAKAYADTVADEAKAMAQSKITTYYQATAPSGASTGDLWIDTTNSQNSLKRYNGSSWVAVDNKNIQTALTNAADAQATADGKIVTFAQTSQPTAASVGDLWIDTDDDNKLYRWNGSAWTAYRDGQIAKSEQAAKDYADGAVSDYDTALNQTKVFNKLTNNGAMNGIYMENGQLYVNATYIKSGTLTLGGANNASGQLIVNDASGNEIGHWNKDGIYVKNGQIYQEKYVDATYGTAWLKMESTDITGGYTGWGNTVSVDLQNTFTPVSGTKKGSLGLTNDKGHIWSASQDATYIMAGGELLLGHNTGSIDAPNLNAYVQVLSGVVNFQCSTLRVNGVNTIYNTKEFYRNDAYGAARYIHVYLGHITEFTYS